MNLSRFFGRRAGVNIFKIESKCKFTGRFAKRSFSISINEDHRTTVDIINRHTDGPLMINTYSREGFRLNNGLFVVGPMVIFPSTVLSWNVANDNDIDEACFSLFECMEPMVDILIIGHSKPASQIRPQINKMCTILRKMKINFEVMESDKACPTYNFLSCEGRFVAAALLPPHKLRLTADDFNDNYKRTKNHGSDDFLIGDEKLDRKEKELNDRIQNPLPPKTSLSGLLKKD